MSETMDSDIQASDADQASSSVTVGGGSDGAGGSSGQSLTDDQHDWVSSFTGIDTRAGASGGAAAASGSSDAASGGGFFSGIANAVSDVASGALNTVENVASDVGHTVVDAASGVVNTVETTVNDLGHTVADAAGGVVNTVTTVAGDVASGNFGDAITDAQKGVATTAGRVVDDAAHTVVDAGSGLLNTAGKIITDTNQTMTDAATGVVSTAGKAVGDVAQGVAQAAGPDSMIGQAAGAFGNAATAVASGVVSGINTANDFNKGVVEGVVGGVEGMATGLVSLGEGVAKEGYALATDAKAREQAGQSVLHGLEAVGQFETTLVTDPSKAMGQVADAASGAVNTVETMAGNVYKGYQAAAAQGHGAEFIGKGVGQAAVVVAGAVLTDGASVAGEGAAVAGEGAALLGEGAAVAGEGAAVVGEGATVLGEGTAVAGEGAALAGEGATAVGEGAAASGEGAALAGEGATAVGEGAAASGEAAAVSGEAATTASEGVAVTSERAVTSAEGEAGSASSGGPRRPSVGATAEGEGTAFRYEYQTETPSPDVTRGRGSGIRPEASAEPVARSPARSHPAAPAGVDEAVEEASEGTATASRSPAGPDELNAADPALAAEVQAPDGPSGFAPREVWEPPAGALPRPATTAPPQGRLAWLRQRLETHLDQAVERSRVDGLTAGQEAALRDQPQLQAAFRGSRIDQFAKDSIMQDPELTEIITAPDFVGEPDILDSVLPDWFDMTTRREWAAHLRRYAARYGSRANLLDTQR